MNKEKITKDQIRSDLKNIRYYYSYINDIEKATQDCNLNFINKIKLYNQMISFASVPLYKIYHQLYILSETQESTSDKLKYSVEYICKLNSKLIDFFHLMMNLPDFVI